MKAHLECVPCMLRQAVQAARFVTDDEDVQREVVTQVLRDLAQRDLRKTPMELGASTHRIVREVTGSPDPYYEIKRRSNRTALELYPELKRLVAASDDPLLTATKIAIAGNIMDFGALAEFDVQATLRRALDSGFARDEFPLFAEGVGTAKQVLYLADNAGEIVFDRVLLEELEGRRITVAVRSEPFINDVLVEDAREVGIDGIAEVIEVAPAKPRAAEHHPAWKSADLIIAKGQANYEAYSEAEGPLFLLLMAKCDAVAQEIGVEKGDLIVLSGEGESKCA